MKYSELITFKPIETTIQLLESSKKDVAKELVSTYVMSATMAEAMQAPVIDQLQMEEVIDNKAIMVVGNFGTGKSHLMSVLSAVANDKANLKYLQNKDFAKSMEIVAGKFEVLRMKIDGLTMPLREIIMREIEDDFADRGINYKAPKLDSVRDNTKMVKEAMEKFQNKYGDKGYLIVIDELLSYLTSRNQQQIVLDLAFLQTLAELCSKSRLRLICGVQEKVFDNPRFSFVSDTLRKVGDRFTQIIITKEATAYVVSERILKKTPKQKAWIREHLEKFTNLYTGMSSRLEEFVDLFPIHPSYIDVFNKIYLIENRHILKNISVCIKKIFDTNVPDNAPGIFSFDDYWPAIKANGLLKSNVTISRVVSASQQLEDIIKRAFTKPAYKPLAIQIIYALSVHRLTTNDLDVEFGLTAENLKDELCLYLPMPEQDADFLLGAVNATLKEIMTTVSGQFIVHNDANNQYYIDVDKIIDYDEKIKQRASTLSASDLNMYFYKTVYSCLEWDAKQYVTNFEIYEYDLNWESHNIYREGYLFMGLPGERSTAQPARDFYIHIMPPYGQDTGKVQHLQDEVYLNFKTNDEFKETLSLYAAANELSLISEGKDKEVYLNKAGIYRKKLVKYLNENKNTCFTVTYNQKTKKIIEVLSGKYSQNANFKDTIDLAASIALDEYFNKKYPEFPVFKTKITRKNVNDAVRASYDYFAGRKEQLSTAMLQSFDVLDEGKIKPEKSKYAMYFINKIKQLKGQEVLNYSDMFEEGNFGEYFDKKYHVSQIYMPIVFLSMVYAGYAVITKTNGKTISASDLDQIAKMPVGDLYWFKYLSKPAKISLAEVKHLFEVLGINPALLDNAKDRDKGIEELLTQAKYWSNNAVLADQKLKSGFELWGEPLVNETVLNSMKKACADVRNEFSNYGARFNTFAKLNNFKLTMEEIDNLAEKIGLIKTIGSYITFKNTCTEIVGYISGIEFIDMGAAFKAELEQAKAKFRACRDSIMNGKTAEVAANQVNTALTPVKEKYIAIYFEEHKKKRLDIKGATRRGKIIESLAMANLKKLRSIEIVSSSKLNAIEKDLADLVVCYELTPQELQSNHICLHCHYQIGDHSKNVAGQLDNIEIRIDALVDEWTKTLLDTITDPLVSNQKEYLAADQKKVINEFEKKKQLPKKVDDFFVTAIKTLLQGFEPVVINTDELLEKLEELPPLDETAFANKMKEILSGYTQGKDAGKIRIVIKRKDSEE